MKPYFTIGKSLKCFKDILAHKSVTFFPKYSPIVLLIIILCFAYFYNYQEILTLRPQGPHQWRQCDCLSITSKFYLNESSFFQPEVYNLLHDNEGKTASDFPLVYYIVSLLWKIFGKHEWIYRLLNFILSIFGMLALLRIFEGFLKESFWSLFSVGILFTSGIYVYYSLNFLMNTTALNMVFIGWYFFFRYYRNGHSKHLYFTFIFFLLGGLLKMSSLISFIALCALFTFEWIGVFQRKSREIIFRNKLAFLASAFIVSVIIVLWLLYISSYNQEHNSGVFLVGILPIWELSRDEISGIIDNIRHIWLEEYFYNPIHYLLISCLLCIWGFFKRSNRTLLILTSLIAIGFAGIVLLFFSPLGQHDYYVIDLLILSVFIMLTFFAMVLGNRSRYRIIDLSILKVLALALLILSMLHASEGQENRFTGWMNQQHTTEFYGYATIEPYLDSLGISCDSKVISMNDPSINITLYLMNRQGWSKYGTNMHDSTAIAHRIEMGAEYLLHHKEIDFASEPHWSCFIEKEVGKYENITIHKIGFPDDQISEPLPDPSR
jgi:hypothetical protein